MNADELLRHYERIADAPNVVARLRAFVVELAVQGRLLGGAPESEAPWPRLPISSLLAEDTRNGYSRRPDEAPDGVPILRISAGTARQDGVVAEEQHKLISGIDAATRELYGLRQGDLLACRFNGNKRFVGSLALFEDYARLRPIFPDKLIRVRVERDRIESKFLLIASTSVVVREQIESLCATTVGNWGISAANLKTIVVPLPPLAEQRRIVAKVDELMALCDRLEAARAQREAVRDRLARSCLARLHIPDPETFHQDARLALDALPALTARPDQIKQLRQTILNLAVRGRLVHQDSNDGAAQVLVNQMLDEAQGRPFPHDEIPLELPSSWAWMRAQEAARPGHTITYGILKPEWVDVGVPTVRVSEMKTGRIDIQSLPMCAPERAAKFSKTSLEVDDLLVSKDGTIGKTAFVPSGLEGGNITQHVLRFPIRSGLNRHFIRLFIDSPPCQRWLSGETKGVALQGVNVGDFRKLPIPIPSLQEQHRIVAKVDQLTALCDRLEASLTQADGHRHRLLETLLHEALEPAAELEAQAA